MKTLLNLFSFGRGLTGGSRFDRYYAGVVRPGAGYPTADEARRDLRRRDRATQPHGWLR